MEPSGEPRPILSYLWGRSRPVVNTLAMAWARAISDDVLWFEPRAPGGAVEPDPTALGAIPPENVFLVEQPAQLAPAEPVTSTTLRSVIRTDDAERLAEFLRLPSLVREKINDRVSGGRRPSVVMASCDRLRPYFPGFVAGNRELIEAVRETGASMVFTVVGEPAPDRFGASFDALIEVEATSLPAWRHGKVVPEKLPDRTVLRLDRAQPLPEIPEVARLLTALAA